MNINDQFGIVEPGIYRCSSSSLQWPPHPYIKFKTVLLLSPELSKNQAQIFNDRQVNLVREEIDPHRSTYLDTYRRHI